MAKKTNSTAKIIEYFKENEDIFDECIEDLDSWNGYLGDDRYYEMDMLNEFYDGVDANEILNRAYFGYDADSWHTDSYGEKIYGAFCPNRAYFTFNGYGNLVSSDWKDYSAFLDEYIVKELADNRGNIYTINENDELSALFDEYEESEGENDDEA